MSQPHSPEFEASLHKDLFEQLCTAWEEYAELVAERDESNSAIMKHIKDVVFGEDTIALRDMNGNLHVYRFTLERV